MGRLKRLRQELEFRVLVWQMTPAVKRLALVSLRAAVANSRREFTFVNVYRAKLAPIILGALCAIVLFSQPGASFEGFKAGLAGGLVWEVGKHIILG